MAGGRGNNKGGRGQRGGYQGGSPRRSDRTANRQPGAGTERGPGDPADEEDQRGGPSGGYTMGRLGGPRLARTPREPPRDQTPGAQALRLAQEAGLSAPRDANGGGSVQRISATGTGASYTPQPTPGTDQSTSGARVETEPEIPQMDRTQNMGPGHGYLVGLIDDQGHYITPSEMPREQEVSPEMGGPNEPPTIVNPVPAARMDSTFQYQSPVNHWVNELLSQVTGGTQPLQETGAGYQMGNGAGASQVVIEHGEDVRQPHPQNPLMNRNLAIPFSALTQQNPMFGVQGALDAVSRGKMVEEQLRVERERVLLERVARSTEAEGQRAAQRDASIVVAEQRLAAREQEIRRQSLSLQRMQEETGAASREVQRRAIGAMTPVGQEEASGNFPGIAITDSLFASSPENMGTQRRGLAQTGSAMGSYLEITNAQRQDVRTESQEVDQEHSFTEKRQTLPRGQDPSRGAVRNGVNGQNESQQPGPSSPHLDRLPTRSRRQSGASTISRAGSLRSMGAEQYSKLTSVLERMDATMERHANAPDRIEALLAGFRQTVQTEDPKSIYGRAANHMIREYDGRERSTDRRRRPRSTNRAAPVQPNEGMRPPETGGMVVPRTSEGRMGQLAIEGAGTSQEETGVMRTYEMAPKLPITYDRAQEAPRVTAHTIRHEPEMEEEVPLVATSRNINDEHWEEMQSIHDQLADGLAERTGAYHGGETRSRRGRYENVTGQAPEQVQAGRNNPGAHNQDTANFGVYTGWKAVGRVGPYDEATVSQSKVPFHQQRQEVRRDHRRR